MFTPTATASHRWPAPPRAAVQARVNWVWAQAQPALFGLLGAAVDVRALVRVRVRVRVEVGAEVRLEV